MPAANVLSQYFPTRVCGRLWMSSQALEANGRSVCWYRCDLMTTGLYFDKLVKNTQKHDSLKFVNVGHKCILLKLSIIQAPLVYLEFAKTYTGSKIVCVPERLGNCVNCLFIGAM